MSDVLGQALIQIEPDFSGFEAQLTRGLTAAVQRAKKAATISLQVDVQQKQVQQFEKSMGGADKVSQALEGHLSEVNQTLGQVSNQLAHTNASIQQLSRIMYELALNSRQAAKETGGPLSKAFETLGAVTRIVETITRVAANIATIVGFSRQIRKLGDTFRENSKDAVGFVGHLKALGRALDTTFVDEKQAHRAADALGSVAGGIKQVGNAVKRQPKGKAKEEARDVEELSAQYARFNRDQVNAIQSTLDFGTAEEEAIKKTGRLRTILDKLQGATPKKGIQAAVVTGTKPVEEKPGTAGSGVKAKLADLFSGAKKGAQEAADASGALIKSIEDKVATASPGIRARFLGLFSGAKKGAQNAADATGDVVKSIEEKVGTAAPGITSRFLGFFSGLKGGNKELAAVGAGAVGASDSVARLGETLRNSATHSAIFTKGIELIKSALSSIGHALLNPITSIRAFHTALTTGLSNAVTAVNNISQGVGTLGRVAGVGGQAFSKLGGIVRGGVDLMKGFAESAGGVKVAAAGMAASGFAVAAIGAGILAGKISEIVHQGIQAAAEMERTKIALKGVFEQTDEAAAKSFDKIQKFAALTPFSLQTAANAVTKLKASFKGFTVENSLSVLKDIAGAGATVGAADEQISRAVLAINQIGAKGKLSAEEINQFTEAIPSVSRIGIFDALASKLGKTTVEVQKLADAGQISGAQGISAILEAARNAPGAATALEKQAASFQGAMSTIKDNFNQVLAISFTPFLNMITKGFNQLGPLFKEIQGPIAQFASSLGEAFTALAPVAGAIVVQFVHVLSALSPLLSIAAQVASMWLGPFELALAGIAKVLDFLITKALRPVVLAFIFMRKTMFDLISFVTSSVGPALSSLGSIIKTALEPVINGLGKAFKAIGGVVSDALGPVFDFVKRNIKVFLILSPAVQLVIAAFFALKGAFIVVKAAIEPVIGFFQRLVPVLASVAGFIGQRMMQSFNLFKSAFEAIGRVIAPVIGFIRDHIKLLLVPVLVALTPVISAVLIAFFALKGAIAIAGAVIQRVGAIIGGTIHGIVGVFQGLVEIATVVGAAIGRRMVQSFNLFRSAAEFVGRAVVTIGGAIVSFGGFLVDLGSKIGGAFGFVSGILEKVGGFFIRLADQARGSIDVFLKFGPIKAIFETIGTVIGSVGDAFDQIGEKFKVLQKIPLLGKLFKGLGGDAKGTGDSFDSLGLDAKETEAKLSSMKKVVVNLDQEMGTLFKTAAGFKTIVNTIQTDLITNPAETALGTAKKQLAELGSMILAPLDPFNNAISAAESVKQAKEQVLSIDKQIADLAKQRTAIQADTTRGAREEFEALQKIKDVNNQIRDLQEEREQLVFDEQRRQAEFAPTLAGFEDQALTASIGLAKAKRDVEDAQKAINEAVKAGMPPEKVTLDLAGLSVDQIKSKLANVRASLRAQQSKPVVVPPEDKARQATELQEGLLTSQIALRAAEKGSLDVAQQKADFLRQSTIAEREYGEQVDDVGTRETQLGQAKTEALREHARLLNGEIGVKAEIKGLTDQITAAETQRATAVKGVADQQKLAAIAAATARGDTAEVLRLTTEMVTQKGIAAGLDAQTNADLLTTIQKIKDQTGAVISLQNAMKELAPIISATNNELVAQERDPQSAINRILALPADDPLRVALLQLLAQRFSGFAQGGVFAQETFARIGEAGKEVLLPLTRPARMAELLGRRDVLAPILANLPRIKLPGPQRTASLGTSTPVSPALSHSPLLGHGGTATMSAQERIKERKAMAEAIADALVVKGAVGSSVEVHAPITVQTPGITSLQERAIVRRILKELEGR